MSPLPTSGYSPLGEDDLPQIGTTLSFDIFIKLPNAGRYIRYACAGDVWDERQDTIVRTHSDPTLYRNETVGREATTETPSEIQVLNDTVGKDLKEIFHFLGSQDEEDIPRTIEAMEELSQKIIAVVAPDVENLKENILQQAKYIMVMTDAAAITSIATLIALSHGFDSRKIFRDLSMAILLMDGPLADISEDKIFAYYRDRSSIPGLEWEEIRRHPARAHEVVSSRLKSIPDTILQLILNHHELYNGQGYPRKLRNEGLPPIVRSLALSVDVFEIMKREHLNGQTLNLLDALEELRQPNVEAHLRRHNQKLVQQAVQYIRGEGSIAL